MTDVLRLITPPSQRGRRHVALVRCPACGQDLTDDDGEPLPGIYRTHHIGTHPPEDFGLSPLAREGDAPTEVSP